MSIRPDGIAWWNPALSLRKRTGVAGDIFTWRPPAAGPAPQDELLDGLISWWGLEAAAGTRIDSHGSNNLTDNNTVGSGAGVINQAAYFTRANSEWLSVADNASLRFPGFTAAFWLYHASQTNSQSYISKWSGTPGQSSFLIDSTSGKVLRFGAYGDGSAATWVNSTFGELMALNWHFVCARYDGSNLKLRVNATADDVLPYAGGIFGGTDPLEVGARGLGTSAVDGRIDELALWNRALTDAQVARLYNGGAGMGYPG